MGLEALAGVKTVAEIAREYQVHPTQVSQWKRAIADRLPEVFEHGATAQVEASEREVARLEQKVGQLTMELDWLKKNPNNWAYERPTRGVNLAPGRFEFAPAMRAAERESQPVLLRTLCGECGESAFDAAAGRIAFGASGLWSAAADRSVAAGRLDGE